MSPAIRINSVKADWQRGGGGMMGLPRGAALGGRSASDFFSVGKGVNWAIQSAAAAAHRNDEDDWEKIEKITREEREGMGW